jgi:hypothetical protein
MIDRKDTIIGRFGGRFDLRAARDGLCFHESNEHGYARFDFGSVGVTFFFSFCHG